MRPMSPRLVRSFLVVAVIGAIYLIANRGEYFGYTWQSYASPDGRFTVELPGKPIPEEQHRQRSDGTDSVYHHVKAIPAARTYFSVAYFDRSTSIDADTLIDNVKTKTAEGLQAMVLSQKPVTVEGRTARDLQFQTPKGVTVMERVVVEDDRYYALIVSTERDPRSEIQNTQRFFDSFKPSHS